MSEGWMMEVLGNARDAARAGGNYRLAEHLDDAMLIAACAYHAGSSEEVEVADGLGNPEIVRGAASRGLH